MARGFRWYAARRPAKLDRVGPAFWPCSTPNEGIPAPPDQEDICDRVQDCTSDPAQGLPCDPDRNSLAAQARSRHPAGVNAALCDGSVRFVKDGIGFRAWFQLLSRNDGTVMVAGE